MILVYGVLLTLILGIGTLLFRQWSRQAGPVRTQQVLRRSGFAILIGVAVILMLRSGAVLLALLTALLPMLRRFLPWLITLAPSLVRHYQRNKAYRSPGGSSNASPQESTVTTRFLSMTLSHQDGRMSGRVLEGPYRGRQLDGLSRSELLDLHRHCQSDPQSVAVLQAYLDRMQPDWRQHASHSDTHGDASANDAMSREEALAILGISAEATRDEIINAHRRLMQKFHPDRGGNDFLASRINLAKSLLLND